MHGWHFGRAEHSLGLPLRMLFCCISLLEKKKSDILEIVVMCLLFAIAVKSRVIITLKSSVIMPLQN